MSRHTSRLGSISLRLIAVLLCSACSSGGGGDRTTTDARVHSLRGQTPPELPADGTWLGRSGSLASLRGRVVYMQFTFPT